MTLLPCPGCHRHVRLDATTCPFCAVTLALETPVSKPQAVGRLTRAAVFAGALAGAAALACGGTQAKQEETNNNNVIQNQGVDAGPEVVPDEVVEPDEIREPERHQQPMPYGAPPSRDRVV